MKIRELKLLYFRNYTSLNIATHPSLNIFFGDNANGKTNIVESIFCLSLGKVIGQKVIRNVLCLEKVRQQCHVF